MDHTLRSRQLNGCDVLFWKSRGYPGRPLNWEQLLVDMGHYDSDSDDDSESQYSSHHSTEDESESEEESDEYDSEYQDHRLASNQNNPNNDAYWQLRGWNGRPDDWRERVYGRA